MLKGDTNKFGGAEGQVARLAAAFAEMGHQVELVCGDGATRPTSQVVADVQCIDAYPLWRRPCSLPAYWVTLQQSRPDLIYARLPNDFLWMAGLYSRLHPGSTFVYALANDRQCNPWQTYRYNKWFHNSLYALGLRSADVVAVQHMTQAQLVRPYTKGKLVLIPNLVRSVASQARGYDDTSTDAIWIARIRPDKQLPLFLDVAKALPDLRFAVVGEFYSSYHPAARQDLEQRMHRLENLSFLGAQRFENVVHLLTHSKVLVNTSSWEGFPNTMLEAWSVGVPVVSLRIDPGGVIRRERIGLVSGTVSRLVNDVERLVRMRSMNCEMGDRGLAYVRETHNLGAVCRAFEQIVPGMQPLGSVARSEVA